MTSQEAEYGANQHGASAYGGSVRVTESPSVTAISTPETTPTSNATDTVETRSVATVQTVETAPVTESINSIGLSTVKLLESADAVQTERGEISVTVGDPSSVRDVSVSVSDSSLTSSVGLTVSDFARITEFVDGNGVITGAVTASDIVESVPLFEGPQLTAAERTDIYNKIFVSETAAMQFTGPVETDSIATAVGRAITQQTVSLLTRSSGSGGESGAVGGVTTFVLSDIATGVDAGGVASTVTPATRDLAIIYSDGLISVGSTVTLRSDTATASDTPQITGLGTEQVAESGDGVSDPIRTQLPTLVRAVDVSIATDGGAQTGSVAVDTAHTAFATPYVSMIADALFAESDTADGFGSARFSNPFDPSVGERGSAVNSASSTNTGVFGLRPVGIATEDELRASNTNSSELFDDTAISVESPTIDEPQVYKAITTTMGRGSARFSQDPLFFVGDTAVASEIAGDESSTIALQLSLSLAEQTTVSPVIGVTGLSPMRASALGIGTERGGLVAQFQDSVLEGTGGVQPERLAQLTRGVFAVSSDGFGTGAATQTTTSPSIVGDEGVAQDTDMSVSESVTLSSDDTGDASDELTASGTPSVQLDEYGVAVSVPQTTTTSRTVIVDEFSSIDELASLVSPNQSAVGDTASARNTSSMQTTGTVVTTDTSRASESGDVVQSNRSALFDERTGVSPRLQINRTVVPTALEMSSATELGAVGVRATVLSPTRIPGLRRIQNVLGIEQDYIFSQPTGSRRRVEVDADDDGNIEVGPTREVVVSPADE